MEKWKVRPPAAEANGSLTKVVIAIATTVVTLSVVAFATAAWNTSLNIQLIERDISHIMKMLTAMNERITRLEETSLTDKDDQLTRAWVAGEIQKAKEQGSK